MSQFLATRHAQPPLISEYSFMPRFEPPSSALKILLCEPRGFCAGVDRAIQIVEKSLQQYGAPVYVRHEIVHNRYVVDDLKKKGAVFVEELSEVPDDGAPVIFSAHGRSEERRVGKEC